MSSGRDRKSRKHSSSTHKHDNTPAVASMNNNIPLMAFIHDIAEAQRQEIKQLRDVCMLQGEQIAELSKLLQSNFVGRTHHGMVPPVVVKPTAIAADNIANKRAIDAFTWPKIPAQRATARVAVSGDNDDEYHSNDNSENDDDVDDNIDRDFHKVNDASISPHIMHEFKMPKHHPHGGGGKSYGVYNVVQTGEYPVIYFKTPEKLRLGKPPRGNTPSIKVDGLPVGTVVEGYDKKVWYQVIHHPKKANVLSWQIIKEDSLTIRSQKQRAILVAMDPFENQVSMAVSKWPCIIE